MTVVRNESLPQSREAEQRQEKRKRIVKMKRRNMGTSMKKTWLGRVKL